MAPQPRVAPPPPPPPPPPVMAPVSPGTQPGSPTSVAPRSTTKNSDNDSPTPRDRSTTTGGGTIKSPDNNSPLPQNRAPATTGGTAGRAAPVAAPVAPSVDRSTALASTSRGLLPARDVAIVSTDGSGGARTEVKTNDKGQFSFGPLAPGVRDITFPFAALQRAQPDGGKKRPPSVTVSLVIPAAPGGGTRGNLVVHTYSRVDPAKDIRTRITVPKDGSGAIVDWGDDTPPVNVVRQGWPIDVGGGGRGPVDTIGTVSFVPKFQKMQFMQMNPCIPWWQCMPPPDPDPPMDDPWTEVLPEIDPPPPEDPIIEIVDYDPPQVDPPRVDPPKIDPPKIDEKGTFEIGSLREGVREVKLTLPAGIVTEPIPPAAVSCRTASPSARTATAATPTGGSARRQATRRCSPAGRS